MRLGRSKLDRCAGGGWSGWGLVTQSVVGGNVGGCVSGQVGGVAGQGWKAGVMGWVGGLEGMNG